MRFLKKSFLASFIILFSKCMVCKNRTIRFKKAAFGGSDESLVSEISMTTKLA